MATPELIRLAQRGALAMRMMGSDEERKTWINENMTEEDKDILVNDFGKWAKSINLDNAVKTNILPAEEGEKQVIQAFYKGTPMPMVFICTPEEWQKQLEEWNPIIVDGLRKGHTLKWQLSLYKAQMEKMEAFILKDCGGKGGNVGEKQVEHLRDSEEFKAFGFSKGQRGMLEIRHLWYMDVHMLLKFGVIKNDHDFGWMILPLDFARKLPDYQEQSNFC